jgi:hypothetical protein
MDGMWQIGMVVEDIDAACEDLARAFGWEWTRAERTIDVVADGAPLNVTLQIAIARQGPSYLELIQGVEGTPWWPPHGLDHIAFWAEELTENAARLEAAGLARKVSYQTADGEVMGMTYHQGDDGLRIEHVDAARRDGMLAWIEGGEFPTA